MEPLDYLETSKQYNNTKPEMAILAGRPVLVSCEPNRKEFGLA